jgi:hypothetical protein
VADSQTLNQEQNGGANDMCKAKATMPPSAAMEGMALMDKRPVSILIKQLSNTNSSWNTINKFLSFFSFAQGVYPTRAQGTSK